MRAPHTAWLLPLLWAWAASSGARIRTTGCAAKRKALVMGATYKGSDCSCTHTHTQLQVYKRTVLLEGKMHTAVWEHESQSVLLLAQNM